MIRTFGGRVPMQTELILPNDPTYLGMARNYVQELCALAGLGSQEAQALLLAADEACTNTIEHAFEPGEAGAYAIKSELTPLALTLAVHDRGLPFDASLAPVYRPPEEAGLEGIDGPASFTGNYHETVRFRLLGDVAPKALKARGLQPDAFDGLVMGWTVPQKHFFYGAPWVAGMIGAPNISGQMVSQACFRERGLLPQRGDCGGLWGQ